MNAEALSAMPPESRPPILSLEDHELQSALGVNDPALARRNLFGLQESGLTPDLFDEIVAQLRQHLPENGDPNRALNNLERFFMASRSPLALGALLQRDPTGLPILLKLFGTSQYLSDYLIRDTESYDALRLTEGQLCAREVLIDELIGGIQSTHDESQCMAILRRFKHRETLRIAFGDLIVEQRVEQVTEQISYVADAICSAALFWARRRLEQKWGVPLSNGERSDFAILAMGKLGGIELNYSSDIDLVLVYESEGKTTEGRSNREFFERLTRDFVKLLHETTDLGAVYRVDLRLRPDGKQGRICNSFESMLQYYDLKGRTWERQALIKARTIAGDLELGNRLLRKLEPWIYRRNLRRSEIEGIQSLKRQIERRAKVEGEEHTNVKTGHGGIRDIEFVIQFLQLLNGHDNEELRTTNTLDAIQRLLSAGVLTTPEATLLVKNYKWLRKVEHRLQILFDLQTHTLPTSVEELDKLAVRLGYLSFFDKTPRDQFEAQLRDCREANRRILDHVLHSAFGIEDAETPPLITDAILQANPDPEMIREAMEPYGFQDHEKAIRHIQALGKEKTRFLSHARCRHFLAAIAHSLLVKISTTPDPDATLVSLRRVSDSIGAKAMLWELFNTNRATIDLYVKLCASSDYLVEILVSNPGMIDELIDSMMLHALPSYNGLALRLKELTRAAEDLDPIIHSFKHSEHLSIGVRDILRVDTIEMTHRALSDVAEICLQSVANEEFQKLAAKSLQQNSIQDVGESGFVILALGKLGGQEPNYHSDLDVVFLYESTPELKAVLKPEYTPQYFFGRLAASISKYISTPGKFGRLFEIDSRLRPTGKSGALAVSFKEFRRYFESGDGQLWERQALCKARVVMASESRALDAMRLVHNAILSQPWAPEMATRIFEMRLAMQENCTSRNLKRGIGGTVDLEFGIQLLQLKSAKDFPETLVSNTIAAARALIQAGQLDRQAGEQVIGNYSLLRAIESRLRLTNASARHDLPEDEPEIRKLAYLLQYSSPAQMLADVENARTFNREWLETLVDSVSSE